MSETTPFGPATRLGLVGLGIMGVPIAERFAEKGYAVTAWNREAERRALVRDAGVAWAPSPAAVWRAADVVFVCVLGDEAIESVCLGPEGFAAAGKGAAVCVDLSTTAPATTLAVAPRLEAATGAAFVDAPMSGGPAAARSGELALILGGEEAVCARLAPLLAVIARNVTRMGETGAGQKAKVLNQAIVGTNYVLMAEILAMAKAAGIDPTRIAPALAGGMADSVILQRIFSQMAADDFDPPRGYARQLAKDLGVVRAFLDDHGLDLPVVAEATDRYRAFAAAGNGTADSAAIARFHDGRRRT